MFIYHYIIEMPLNVKLLRA